MGNGYNRENYPPSDPEGTGWKVDKKVLAEFLEEMQHKANMVFGVDCDGDSAVVVSVTDRSRYQLNHYFDLPHRDDSSVEKEVESYERRLSLAMTNMSMAVEACKQSYNVLMYLKDEKRDKE